MDLEREVARRIDAARWDRDPAVEARTREGGARELERYLDELEVYDLLRQKASRSGR